jgi:hypothetical protein
MYPLTLCSSTANVFMASCMRSKEVDFQTKSAEKLWLSSLGTPSFRRSSRPISSETSKRNKCQPSRERTSMSQRDALLGTLIT